MNTLFTKCATQPRATFRRGLLFLSLLLAPAIRHASISIMPLEARLEVARPGARLTNDIRPLAKVDL